jgi:hypothetical protein
MSSDDIEQTLRDRGFRVLVPPFRNGNVYVADVVDPRGIQERLVVDAYQGTIVQRFRAARGPRAEARRDLPWPGTEEDPGIAPTPYARYPLDDPRRSLRAAPRNTGSESASPSNDAVPERTARAPSEADVQPNVVPGVGPDATGAEPPKPKVKRVVKKRAPESQVVRATPLQPPDKAVTPAPVEPQAAPAAQTAPSPAPAKPAAVATRTAPTPPTPASTAPKAPLNDIPAAPLD